MASQLRGFVMRLTTNVNVFQLVALGLALGAMVIPLYSGGGGGSGV